MDLAEKPTLPDSLIQVAGVLDLEEAKMLLDTGVDLIGIPLRLPVNAEDISEDEAAFISRSLPGRCCLITYQQDLQELAALVNELQVSFLQIHGPFDHTTLPRLRSLLPSVAIIKSLVIGKDSTEELFEEMNRFSPFVEAFITDTYDPASGAEGATGLTHDWEVSRKLCLASPRPVILAGGLNPQNVRAAIQAVQPAGIDVHTGIEETNGRKSPSMTQIFVSEARAAISY